MNEKLGNYGGGEVYPYDTRTQRGTDIHRPIFFLTGSTGGRTENRIESTVKINKYLYTNCDV